MARQCTICAHKSRKEIDKALAVDGASIRGIARTFRVSEDSLSRHVKGGHLIAKIQQAVKAQEVAEANDLLGEIQEAERITKDIISESLKIKTRQVKTKEGIVDVEVPPDHEMALKALTRREKQIELKGKVLGAFKDPKSSDGSTKLPAPALIAPLTPEAARKIGDIVAGNL